MSCTRLVLKKNFFKEILLQLALSFFFAKIVLKECVYTTVFTIKDSEVFFSPEKSFGSQPGGKFKSWCSLGSFQHTVIHPSRTWNTSDSKLYLAFAVSLHTDAAQKGENCCMGDIIPNIANV